MTRLDENLSVFWYNGGKDTFHKEGSTMISNIQWLCFDIGSTLVEESRVEEDRMRQIAAWGKVDYEYVYDTAVMFYKQNLKGDLEMIKLLRIEKPEWKSEFETLYADAEPCLKRLKAKYKIGVIANQPLGRQKDWRNSVSVNISI